MIVSRVRALWSRLAAVPVTFASDGGVTVVVSPESALCPPGWAGIVVVGGAGIATAPDPDTAQVLRRALGRLPASAATDIARVRAEVPITDVLGPATLAYLDAAQFRAPPPVPVQRIDGNLDDLLACVPADEAGESGLADLTSDAFVVRDGGRVVAAAGYHCWLDTTAQLCVLTAPDHRGRGLATAVAAAAVQHALADGLLPQWRARIDPSRRVARALGFRELGAQLSIKL
jgi:GNAT superfamily N-acetyltransferase